MSWVTFLFFAWIVGFPVAGPRHDGPDPVGHWKFDAASHRQGKLLSRLGPDGRLTGKVRVIQDAAGESIFFNGRGVECVLADNHARLKASLPKEALTVSAWVAINEPEDFGGILGVLQDNGDREAGWVLGYQKNHFSFGLASVGADDGDGKMTYLQSSSEFELGRMYHVVAVYDGTSMELYVNGELTGRSQEQSGPILYPAAAPFVIAAYHDENEFHPLVGRLREIGLYGQAARAKWVKEEFEHHQRLAALTSRLMNFDSEFVVQPFLQYGTTTEMTVVWRGATEHRGTLHWGETIQCSQQKQPDRAAEINQVTLDGLRPETQYFYWVESEDANSQPIESQVRTFQTASLPGTPIAFVVMGDTQGNPEVSGKLSELAWAQRPNFMIHAGDLVDKGKQADDWIDEFFASMKPLICRVPMYPVLGNHEQNARNYFDYMALPDPEYYYRFEYGDAEFFMIDSNRKIDPDSEQYQWLDQSLQASTATWKFVCHHHPPYSSDENDYGDLWKTNQSTRGDLRARQLVTLYDKHSVDLVWNGHIHSYERTWPMKQHRATSVDRGTIYMITGGGGGGLETPGPYRPHFQNTVMRGHHYTLVTLQGETLQLKAFNLNGQLFDTVELKKRNSKTRQ